jgi:glycosyltransferase involved in cell wall biosynthesis
MWQDKLGVNMENLVYFTICSRNYMAYALTLGRSLVQANPKAKFVIGMADEWPSGQYVGDVEFEVIPASNIGLPTFDDMITRYSVMELNTAIKPRMIRYLMEDRGFERVVYLDPDIFVISPLIELSTRLDDGVECVLTPHALAPLDDGGDPNDVRLLRTGVYNLGFVAMRRSINVSNFLKWWETQLETKCVVDLENGLFVDQKFMDLAPCYIENTHILRHAGYNVAYWNLTHRHVKASNRSYEVNEQPLRFVHFSGVAPKDASVFSKHQNRFTPENIGDLKPIFDNYLKRLKDNGNEAWSAISYAFDQRDGITLDSPLRRVYAEQHPLPRRNTTLSGKELIRLANQPARLEGPAFPTRYVHALWKSREDLRKAFDVDTANGRTRLAEWVLSSGIREVGISDALLQPARDALQFANQLQPTAEAPGLKHRIARRLIMIASHLRFVAQRLPNGLTRPVKRWLRAAISTSPYASTISQKPKQKIRREDDGVAIYGNFGTESGVGEGARQAHTALQQAGYTAEAHSILALGGFANNVEYDNAQVAGASGKPVRLFHINADQTPHILDALAFDEHLAGSYKVAYWAWELSKFPAVWTPAAERLDEIWTPSEFTAKAIRDAVDCPVYVVPHPVQVTLDQSPDARSRMRDKLGFADDEFVVLVCFDFNSYLARKNPEAALSAFQKARRVNDKLRLVLKVHGNSPSPQQRRQFLQQAEAIEGVIIIDGVMSREEIDELQWASDTFMSLHRSEGFGLNILECMAKGKPVIATDYSGSMDFLDSRVGIPIPYTLIEVGKQDYPFPEGQVWADADVSAAAEALVTLSNDILFSERLGKAAQSLARTQYSPKIIGRIMIERLQAISQQT